MPKHESDRVNSPSNPFRTPTLVGCALAVDKLFFMEIGGFDDAFNIWGGENIEIAWRYWMCGSGAFTHPCSRVAHTFKPFAFKYDGDREKTVQKNLMRTADVWMDDWIKYFYASTYNWPSKRTYFTRADRKRLEKRHELRKQLGCKNFTWYMETIFPEMPRPVDESTYYGEVANEKSEACWYLTNDSYVGLTYFCFFHRILPENIFFIDNVGRLHFRDSRCIRVDRNTLLLRVGACEDISHGNLPEERWEMDHSGPVRGLIKVRYPSQHQKNEDKNEAMTLCVLQVTNVNTVHANQQMAQLTDCDYTNEFMYWRWTYKFDFEYTFDEPF